MEKHSTNFSDMDTKARDCWKDIESQNYTIRFWAETFSLSIMNCSVIFGNFLVALAPMLNRRLRNPGHYFIASLAWADFALGIFVIPVAISIQTRNGLWPYGSAACQLWQTLDIMLCTTSIYSLIAVTFDRYIAVTKPLMYKTWMTKRTCVILILVVWLGSLAVSLPSLLPQTWSRNDYMVTNFCKCTPAANGSAFILFSSIASFFLPMLIIFYFYTHIYITVRKIRLNATRGVVNVRRRSPTTTTGTVTGRNGEFENAFYETSTLAVSTAEVHNKKLFTRNGINKPRFIIKSEKSIKIGKSLNERTTLLLPETPLHNRRISDGPVLRMHKGGYHARKFSGKKANGVFELVPVTKHKISIAVDERRNLPDHDKNGTSIDTIENRCHENQLSMERATRDDMKHRSVANRNASNLCPPSNPNGLISPSPSQITMSALGIHGNFDEGFQNSTYEENMSPARNSTRSDHESSDKKSISSLISEHDIAPDKKSILDNPHTNPDNRENRDLSNDAWLRLALPSQLVSAWAQRMLALHRYRRKLSLELRALKTVVMVTGCFFVCWTGFCVVYTMQALPTCHRSNWWGESKLPQPDDSCLPDWVFNLFIWLGYVNSAANPIVYGAMNAQFRKTFYRFLPKGTGKSHAI